MAADPKLTFYHSPQTRSSAVLTLLEELGAPYDLHVLNMKAGEQRQPAYLAINPLGKVPAIKAWRCARHGTRRHFHLSRRRISERRARAADRRSFAWPLSAMARVLWLGLRAGARRSFNEAGAGASRHESLRNIRRSDGDHLSAIEERAVSFWRAFHRRGRALGRGAALDDGLWTRSCVAGNIRLCEALRGSSGGAESRRDGCKALGATPGRRRGERVGYCHCEERREEAIQEPRAVALDRFAALAMTDD